MSRVVFLYFHGTDPLIGQWLATLGQAVGQQSLGLLTVAGLDGRTASWLDGSPRNDPFPSLLDPNIFEAYSVPYPAVFVPFKDSVNVGITKLITAINRLPNGQKYMIGGYSQGAVVAGTVYSKIKSGELGTKAANDFLGGCCFGSPVRQRGFRGEVGGTWSGLYDTNANTGGGGQFSATGTFPRLTNCDPTKWIEFADYGDIFTCVGDTPLGQNWTTASDILNDAASALAVGPQIFNILGDVLRTMGSEFGSKVMTYTDAAGRTFNFGGNGHVAYPWRPPPGNPDGNLTSYQIAIKWLTSKALQYATAPILMQSSPSGSSASTAGWTTSLTAP